MRTQYGLGIHREVTKMQLIEEEGEIVQIRSTQREKTIEEFSLILLGSFLTAQPYNQNATKAMLRSVWKLGNDLSIVDVGEGLFQFRSKMESQLTWVLNNGPWNLTTTFWSFNGGRGE